MRNRTIYPSPPPYLEYSELVHHAIHHQELGSIESVCVQFVCNGGKI